MPGFEAAFALDVGTEDFSCPYKEDKGKWADEDWEGRQWPYLGTIPEYWLWKGSMDKWRRLSFHVLFENQIEKHIPHLI